MKYLAAAVATLFVVAAQAPAANAETATCAGGVYNSACIAGLVYCWMLSSMLNR